MLVLSETAEVVGALLDQKYGLKYHRTLKLRLMPDREYMYQNRTISITEQESLEYLYQKTGLGLHRVGGASAICVWLY